MKCYCTSGNGINSINTTNYTWWNEEALDPNMILYLGSYRYRIGSLDLVNKVSQIHHIRQQQQHIYGFWKHVARHIPSWLSPFSLTYLFQRPNLFPRNSTSTFHFIFRYFSHQVLTATVVWQLSRVILAIPAAVVINTTHKTLWHPFTCYKNICFFTVRFTR